MQDTQQLVYIYPRPDVGLVNKRGEYKIIWSSIINYSIQTDRKIGTDFQLWPTFQ